MPHKNQAELVPQEYVWTDTKENAKKYMKKKSQGVVPSINEFSIKWKYKTYLETLP